MARLSGLPSEHHHEGPRDAPRRKRTRNSQPPSDDLTTHGKRFASPGAEASISKRTKHAQLDDRHQTTEELDDEDDTIHIVPQKSPGPRRNRRYSEPLVAAQDHTNASDDEEVELASPAPVSASQPIVGLTPHLDRLGAPRARFSHAARRARMSMPAQLSLEPVDETDGNRRVQFAPLSAVLDSRTRRRLRRSHLSQEVNEIEEHQKEDKKRRKELAELRRQLLERDDAIKDLEYQLEARRLGNIDMSEDRKYELEQQLEQAKKEIEDLRASSIYTGSDKDPGAHDMDMEGVDDDDDDLMLIRDEEVTVSQENFPITPFPQGTYATRALEISSQMTIESLSQVSQVNHDTLAEPSETPVSDKLTDQAVERYEREVQHYVHLLAESQGALRIIAIELQNLHITSPGTTSNEILKSLRTGFETFRDEVDRLLPDTSTGLDNLMLLRKIPELISGMLAELSEHVTLINAQRKTEQMLRAQYESVLDHLGNSTHDNEDLEIRLHDLDCSNKEKLKALGELEASLEAMSKTADDQLMRIGEKDKQLQDLLDEIEDKDTTLHRLRESLNKYREDLDSVTATATRLEEEHRDTISRMENEYNDTIRDLQSQLAIEIEGRETAESDAQQKDEIINDLEDHLNRLETEFGSMREQLHELTDRLATEKAGREVAESERDDQVTAVYEHANTIENLNGTVIDLQNQLTEFREAITAERSQREQTEAELDEANDKIEDLNARVYDIGVQADELRSKLLQTQQEKEDAIAQLNEEADERENELQDSLDAELQHGKESEMKIAMLEETISRLENDLTGKENHLTQTKHALVELQQDRDDLLASLTAQLSDLKSKYAALQNGSNSTITTLEANIHDLNNHVRNQKAEIDRLSEEAAEEKRVFQEDAAIMAAKMEDLEDDLAMSRDENKTLTEENQSLARRVENEANELLNIMGAHVEESKALRSVIETQDATIKSIQSTATQRMEEHAEEILEKQQEIEDLRIVGDARAETIVALEAQIDDMKERFRVQEEDTRSTMDTLIESQRRLQEQNEQLAAALKKRSADALLAIQEMKVKGVEIKTRGVDLHKVANGKVTKINDKVKVVKKGGKKKVSRRQWDSGFGVDENVEEVQEELVA